MKKVKLWLSNFELITNLYLRLDPFKMPYKSLYLFSILLNSFSLFLFLYEDIMIVIYYRFDVHVVQVLSQWSFQRSFIMFLLQLLCK